MPRIQYQFNPETLSYKKVEISLKDIIVKNFIPQSAIAIFGGILLYAVASFYIDSPEERQLQRQNEELTGKYELLNNRIESAYSELAEMQYRDDNVYRMVFERNPVPEEVRKAGFGGINRYKHLENENNAGIIINANKKIDKLSKQLVVQSKSYDEIIALVLDKEKMLASIPAIQPIAIKDLTRFGSAFGMRLHPIHKVYKMHMGIDLTCPRGTKIYAAGDGEVVLAKHSNTGYGNQIRIDHGYGYLTLYSHLYKIQVKQGDKVKRGDVIGLVGSTGLSTRPHLHYEVRINGKPVNPINYYYNDLTEEEYEKMINLKSTNTHTFQFEEHDL